MNDNSFYNGRVCKVCGFAHHTEKCIVPIAEEAMEIAADVLKLAREEREIKQKLLMAADLLPKTKEA